MAHDLRITAHGKNEKEETEQSFTIEGGSKLEIFDENENCVYEGEFKSFTANFLKLLYGSMVGAGAAKAKDLSNADVKMNAFPQSAMNLSGGTGLKKFGVVVGTSNTPVSVTDYSITVQPSLTLGATSVGVSTVDNEHHCISVEISRQISNTSGSTVTLAEAGLICGSEDDVDSNVLIARDIKNPLVTLETGKKTTVRYTINFNFANDKGGFVRGFADKMFNGIFEEVTASADWSARYGLGCLTYDGKMWVLGGYSGTDNNDVWYSTDGSAWTQAPVSGLRWTARRAMGTCVYDGKMWVLGGYSGADNNDAWYSTDGSTWTQAAGAVGWRVRNGLVCLSYEGKMWVLGGNYGDVWNYSIDTAIWTEVTPLADWGPRINHGGCVYDGKMWVMGGAGGGNTYNDVWYSTDGSAWTPATGAAGWAPRYGFACLSYDDKMWVMGGTNSSNQNLNDVWYSTDGENWTQATASAGWTARRAFGAAVVNGRIYIAGGRTSSSIPLNDTWCAKLLSAEITVGAHGASETPFSAAATTLGSEISDGEEPGELVYGPMPSSTTAEPSSYGNKTTFSLAREFTNHSGAAITIKEVGLFSGGDMIARLILANPVTIPDNGSDVITIDFETEA